MLRRSVLRVCSLLVLLFLLGITIINLQVIYTPVIIWNPLRLDTYYNIYGNSIKRPWYKFATSVTTTIMDNNPSDLYVSFQLKFV